MSFKKSSLRIVMAVCVGWAAMCCASTASATFTFSVTPAHGPNGFLSPSFGAYGVNAIKGLRGLGPFPTDYTTDPTAYTTIPAMSDIEIRDFVVTNFSSYRGIADPAPVPFPAERGNMVYFGFTYKNAFPYPTTGMIQLEDVIWETRYYEEVGGATVDSNFVLDPHRSDYISTPGNPNYSPFRYGLNYGIDRIPGTFDDLIVSSGTPDQLVDELYYVGVGEALIPTHPGANNQNTIQLLTEGWKQETGSTGVSVEACYYLDEFTVKLGCSSVSLVMNGDFDNDGVYGCADVDALTADIVAGSNTPEFDLTSDGLVNFDDLVAWLSEAGETQLGPGKSYQFGDANLDGMVGGSDFNIWNMNKFTVNSAWCAGNFNGDSFVDGRDFNLWNMNKFTSAEGGTVPEPAAVISLLTGLAILAWRRR